MDEQLFFKKIIEYVNHRIKKKLKHLFLVTLASYQSNGTDQVAEVKQFIFEDLSRKFNLTSDRFDKSFNKDIKKGFIDQSKYYLSLQYFLNIFLKVTIISSYLKIYTKYQTIQSI